MYHSITFKIAESYVTDGEERNTWDDWHLVPTSRPVVNPPSVKTKYVDIPGGNGSLDLTTVLTKQPLYGQRTGSWEFLVMNDYEPWDVIYRKIMDYIHGMRVQVFPEDEPGYYYEGRISVNNWKSDVHNSYITLDYTLDPYKKWALTSSDENWLWDPLDLEDGIILPVAFNVVLDSENDYQTFQFRYRETGRQQVIPTFIFDNVIGDVSLTFRNPELSIFSQFDPLEIVGNKFYSDEIIFSAADTSNVCTLRIKGKCNIKIDFRGGNL